MVRTGVIWLIACVLLASESRGQATKAQPYNAQLRTDPSVGNVQGIQRYGRPMRSDPDEGTGFSYHVYPVADYPQNSLADALTAAALLSGEQRARGMQSNPAAPPTGVSAEKNLPIRQASALSAAFADPTKTAPASDTPDEARQAAAGDSLTKEAATSAVLSGIFKNQFGYAGSFGPFGPIPFGPYGAASPYPAPFDVTAGLRNYSTELGAPETFRDPLALSALYAAKGIGLNNVNELITLYHQPLIQVKVRVVEVIRNDGMRANSILEYVSRKGEPSLTTGTPANDMMQNFRGISTFPINGLVTSPTSGSGVLLNLTSEHINWALQLLATEFNADVVTAPEVVTLNGQNVEFVSGSKVPFELGQNVIQGSNNNIQQFFYKNVGTLVSVTPKIVNWGFHGEGGGEAAIADSEITDWNALAAWMLDKSNMDLADDLPYLLPNYATNHRPIPFETKSKMLQQLNQLTRSDVLYRQRSTYHDAPEGPGAEPLPLSQPMLIDSSNCDQPGALCESEGPIDASVLKWFRPDELWIEKCHRCNWKPEDCTIDMAIVVRLSEEGDSELELTTGNNDDVLKVRVPNEENVRAVANVIQVKSGNGVVMAGLIGDREEEAVAKTPVLGDLPWVGALFRSKETIRQKTEVLIFVEAQVLDPRPEVARAESYADYRLGYPYVDGPLLDNPLEQGMYRVGFGTYLPPIRCGEECFWVRHHRKVQKICTHVDDFKE